jgi:hypothetical protein
MTATSRFYPRAMLTAFRKEWSWQTDSIYAAILKHNYDYSENDTYWSDISSHEISSGTVNYSTNGIALNSKSVSGVAANSWSNAWAPSTSYSAGYIIRPTTGNGHVYLAQNTGVSGATQPTWPTIVGQTVSDGTMVWNTCGSYVTALACTDPQWNDITFSNAGYLAIYSRTPATDSARPLIALIDFGGAQSVTSGTFKIDAPASGILVALTY